MQNLGTWFGLSIEGRLEKAQLGTPAGLFSRCLVWRTAAAVSLRVRLPPCHTFE